MADRFASLRYEEMVQINLRIFWAAFWAWFSGATALAASLVYEALPLRVIGSVLVFLGIASYLWLYWHFWDHDQNRGVLGSACFWLAYAALIFGGWLVSGLAESEFSLFTRMTGVTFIGWGYAAMVTGTRVQCIR